MVNYKTFLSNKKNLEGHTLRFKQSLSHFTMPAAMGATPFTSWNMELKEIWKLPYQTHRYFFEHHTPCKHLNVLLIKSFLKFVKSIIVGQKSSLKLLLRTVAGNVNSTTGKNMRNIELVDPIQAFCGYSQHQRDTSETPLLFISTLSLYLTMCYVYDKYSLIIWRMGKEHQKRITLLLKLEYLYKIIILGLSKVLYWIQI